MDRVLERALREHGDRKTSTSHTKDSLDLLKVDKKREAPKPAEPLPDVAIFEILKAHKEKDYFKILQLPYPEVDELDRPVWSCSAKDVSKAFRRLSVFVHPDKNPGKDAREAFEALTEAHRLLKDPSKLEEALKGATGKALEERSRREGRANVDERIQLNAARNIRAKQLRRDEGKSFQDEIVKQMQRRQEELKRKKELTSRCRREEDDKEEEEEDHAKQDIGGRSNIKRRKKPVFI